MPQKNARKSHFLMTFAVLAGTALAPAAGLAQKVHTDYDRRADFGKYHTYCWNRVHASNQLVEQRIQDAVRRSLNHRGWTESTESCDVSIAAIGMVHQQQEYTTFYNSLGPGWGWGGGWGWWGGGGGPAITRVDQIPVGTLVVDLYDGQSKRLVWRGTAQQELSDNPEKNIPKLNKAVDKMFKDFPPHQG